MYNGWLLEDDAEVDDAEMLDELDGESMDLCLAEWDDCNSNGNGSRSDELSPIELFERSHSKRKLSYRQFGKHQINDLKISKIQKKDRIVPYKAVKSNTRRKNMFAWW